MPVKRKKKSKIYFGQKTQDAIIRYNKCKKRHIKNRIYEEHIDAAFNKLAENLIHTFKFYYFDVPLTDVKHEVVAFLLMNMHKNTIPLIKMMRDLSLGKSKRETQQEQLFIFIQCT